MGWVLDVRLGLARKGQPGEAPDGEGKALLSRREKWHSQMGDLTPEGARTTTTWGGLDKWRGGQRPR